MFRFAYCWIATSWVEKENPKIQFRRINGIELQLLQMPKIWISEVLS
jgi:hypothetical protein